MAQLAWDPCKEALLATAGSDKTVRVWDTRASKCVASVDTKGENISLAYRRDGTYVVVGNKKDHVSWIDTRTFQVVFDRSFSGETNEVGFDLSGLFYATTGLGTVDVYEGAPTKSDFKVAWFIILFSLSRLTFCAARRVSTRSRCVVLLHLLFS